MNEVFIGGKTVHHTNVIDEATTLHSECYLAFGRGGGTYAS